MLVANSIRCVSIFRAMAVYRYSPASIDSISCRIRRHHIAGFVIFTVAVCAGAVALLGLRTGLIYDAIFSLVIALTLVRTRHKARQRTIDLLRSTEFEIDDEKASYRSNLSEKTIPRPEIVEACFSRSGILLRGKSRWGSLAIPSDIEDFDKLPTLLEEWLPKQAARRNSLPSRAWAYAKLYGTWAGAALLLYTAMVSQTLLVAIPACVLAATGIAWYLAWCGRKINERKWKVLLPLSGYLGAVALLGRALALWVTR